MGSCGFGDSGPVFPAPKVEEDVKVGGIILRLDREKWGYSLFAATKEGVLARFSGERCRSDTSPLAADARR